MHADHAGLIELLRRAARPDPGERHDHAAYTGSDHPFHNVSTPDRRAIARRWLAAQKGAPGEAILAMVDSLFAGASHEEKTLAPLILGYAPSARRAARPDDLYRWLGELHGWAEVDSLCQNTFTAADMLADWPAWRGLIERLSRDPDINRRRASLVLLTSPVRTSDDPRFRDLTFVMIDRLKGERPILITKAVSWLLRSMVGRHPDAVDRYLKDNAASLPKIAMRETRVKLETGTKSGRGQRRP